MTAWGQTPASAWVYRTRRDLDSPTQAVASDAAHGGGGGRGQESPGSYGSSCLDPAWGALHPAAEQRDELAPLHAEHGGFLPRLMPTLKHQKAIAVRSFAAP
jgi:hypothetical protein